MLRRPLPHRPNAKKQTAASPVPDRKKQVPDRRETVRHLFSLLLSGKIFFSDRDIDGFGTPVSSLCQSEKTKTEKNPLRRMQNVSYEPWTLYPSENPSSKLGYFQTTTSSPDRVLHPAQGDKQK
ncbi:MAG: hypothetical protein PUD40_06130 [Bacteroidales bacterium]|nr:hypothetical protein [Bacteroidales bacterium]